MTKIKKEKLIRRAKKLFKREEYEKCVKTTNKILKSFPDELDIYKLKIDALFILLDYNNEIGKTAIAYLKKSPKDESDYLITIDYLDGCENYDLKMSVIEESLKSYPESYDLKILKVKSLYFDFKEYEKAIEYIDSFSKTDPYWKDVMYFKAKIYENSKDYDKSLEVYYEILKSYNDHELKSFKSQETLTRILKTLKILERDEEALDLLNKMIKEGNEKTWALVNKGLYLQGTDNQRALEFIDEAIENDSEYGFSYFGKASVLYEMGDYEDLDDHIKKAISLDEEINENPDFKFLLAKIANEANDPDSALKIIKGIDYDDFIYEEAMDFSMKIYSSKYNEIFEEMGINDENNSLENLSDKELLSKFFLAKQKIKFFDDR